MTLRLSHRLLHVRRWWAFRPHGVGREVVPCRRSSAPSGDPSLAGPTHSAAPQGCRDRMPKKGFGPAPDRSCGGAPDLRPRSSRASQRPDVLGSRTLDPRTDPRVQSSCSSTDDAQTHVTNHVPTYLHTSRASVLPRMRNPMPPTRVSCAFLGRRPGTVAAYQLPKATKSYPTDEEAPIVAAQISDLSINFFLRNTSQNLLGEPSGVPYTLPITRRPISSRICLK